MSRNNSAEIIGQRTTLREIAAGLEGLPQPAGLRLPATLLSDRNPGTAPHWPAGPPRRYLRPEYAKSFACIGAQCEDNCCKGWSVPIDQATYEKYRQTPGLKPHLGTLVVLNTDHSAPSDYARIPLTAQQDCGFLDDENMCGIQKAHGPEMLSATCKTYPRALANNAGQVEMSLNLSCPEAARMTLLNADLLGDGPWMTQGPTRYDTVTRRRPIAALSTQMLDKADRLGHRLGKFESRLAVREFALLLLGDRRYPTWQRLYLLGNLARRMQASSEASGNASVAEWCDAFPGKVSKLLQETARTAATESMRPAMNEIAFRPGQQIQTLLEMLRIRFQEPPVPMRFLECVQDFQLGLGTATAQSEQEILDAYSASYRQYYLPLMEQYPQLLENHLTNWIFKNNYPFGKKELPHRPVAAPRNAENEHLALCVQAALTQTLLIGMAGYYKESFNATHVVKLVQSLAKTLEHSQRSIEQIAEFVQTRNLNNPQGVALLLRMENPLDNDSKSEVATGCADGNMADFEAMVLTFPYLDREAVAISHIAQSQFLSVIR